MGCKILQDSTTATMILRNFPACEISEKNFVLQIFLRVLRNFVGVAKFATLTKFSGFTNTSLVEEIKHKPAKISQKKIEEICRKIKNELKNKD